MQAMSVIFPIMYAVFLWWFTTGLIIIIYDRSRWLVLTCFTGMTFAMVLAVAGVHTTGESNSIGSMLIALTCGVVIWGWQVAAYYLNVITGTDERNAYSYPLNLKNRFWIALNSSIYHELMALAFAVGLIVLTWSAQNKWAMFVYVALWLMHTSAKLNVFLGVRNFHIDFLPKHLHHLEDTLGRRTSNAFFPISIILATSVVLVLIYRGIIPPAHETQTAGSLALATLISLGILEHLLLVIPVPSTLYGWGLRALPDEDMKPQKPGHRVVLKSEKGQT